MPFTNHQSPFSSYRIQGRNYPAISVDEILSITPERVRVHWGVTKPADPGLVECEERCARLAGAAAGFNHVLIHGNIHPTTSHGARRTGAHINVRFISSRYGEKPDNDRGQCSRHVFVAVYSTYLGSWSNVPFGRGRPDRFDWSTVHQDPRKGQPRFGSSSARDQATQEYAYREELERARQEEVERRRREESERRRREESERRRREESERRRREESERRRREESERRRREEEERRRLEDAERRRRQDEERRREEEERRGRRGNNSSGRHHRGRDNRDDGYWEYSESYRRYYHRHRDGSVTWRD